MTYLSFGELGGDNFESRRSRSKSATILQRSAEFVYESSILSNEKSYKSSDAYDEHLFREANPRPIPKASFQPERWRGPFSR